MKGSEHVDQDPIAKLITVYNEHRNGGIPKIVDCGLLKIESKSNGIVSKSHA